MQEPTLREYFGDRIQENLEDLANHGSDLDLDFDVDDLRASSFLVWSV